MLACFGSCQELFSHVAPHVPSLCKTGCGTLLYKSAVEKRAHLEGVDSIIHSALQVIQQPVCAASQHHCCHLQPQLGALLACPADPAVCRMWTEHGKGSEIPCNSTQTSP